MSKKRLRLSLHAAFKSHLEERLDISLRKHALLIDKLAVIRARRRSLVRELRAISAALTEMQTKAPVDKPSTEKTT